jgi:hypothetical protein
MTGLAQGDFKRALLKNRSVETASVARLPWPHSLESIGRKRRDVAPFLGESGTESPIGGLHGGEGGIRTLDRAFDPILP